MKAVVSGANGFIGRNLCNKLKSLGHTVIPVPREYLYDFEALQKFFLKHQPQWIFHAAAYGNQGRSGGQTEPDLIVTANIGGTFNMLEASLSIPYEAFINFGSSSEYGEKVEPMVETDFPETDTFYGATKIGATYLARAFAKQYAKPIVNVRPFSVYGAYEADFRFIPIVIRNVLSGTTFPLEEKATHDWIYVKDFVKGVLLVTENAKKLQGEWVNIGTGRSFTNKMIVEQVEIFLNKKAKYKKAEGMRPGHSFFWEANINKIASLGFKPSYDISEGLAETIKFYKKRYVK